MAAAVWPDYADFRAERELGADSNVRRTEFADGGVRQERTTRAAMRVRSIEALLGSDADLARFRAWMDAHAHTWFHWRDPEDAVLRRARVRGGAGAVRYRSSVSAAGSTTWTATLELEGWADDVVPEAG